MKSKIEMLKEMSSDVENSNFSPSQKKQLKESILVLQKMAIARMIYPGVKDISKTIKDISKNFSNSLLLNVKEKLKESGNV